MQPCPQNKRQFSWIVMECSINHMGSGPNSPEELILLPGVPEVIRRLNEAGFLVFVVTNQGA